MYIIWLVPAPFTVFDMNVFHSPYYNMAGHCDTYYSDFYGNFSILKNNYIIVLCMVNKKLRWMTGDKHINNIFESQGFEEETLMLAVYDVWCLIIWPREY